MAKGTSKKRLEKKIENRKRESIESNITNVGGLGVDESKDVDDNKTVLYDTTPLTEMRKDNEKSAIAILDKYEKENNDVKLETLNKEDFIKLKGMSSILGLPLNIKKTRSISQVS